jgi:glutamine amidotransferase
MKDEDFEINLAEEKKPSQAGYVVATTPLTSENWTEFRPGELIVFRGGKKIY